jgi:hypothetical protein
VAYRFHEVFAATANAARDQFFNAEQIASIVAAHSAVSGFVFTNLDSGLPMVLVSGRDGSEQLAFTLPVAGGRFLGNALAFDKIYPAGSIRSGVQFSDRSCISRPIKSVQTSILIAIIFSRT